MYAVKKNIAKIIAIWFNCTKNVFTHDKKFALNRAVHKASQPRPVYGPNTFVEYISVDKLSRYNFCHWVDVCLMAKLHIFLILSYYTSWQPKTSMIK